jgi:branched-subunit amino acid aminotransferase/4-amino-4-deoxychorismate lyase
MLVDQQIRVTLMHVTHVELVSMVNQHEKLYLFMWDLLKGHLQRWTGHYDTDGGKTPYAEKEIRNLLQVARTSHSHSCLSFNRDEMNSKKENLYDYLAKSGPHSEPSLQEYELIALVVSQAVLNSCENLLV